MKAAKETEWQITGRRTLVTQTIPIGKSSGEKFVKICLAILAIGYKGTNL
jgi:hypothetical protein